MGFTIRPQRVMRSTLDACFFCGRKEKDIKEGGKRKSKRKRLSFQRRIILALKRVREVDGGQHYTIDSLVFAKRLWQSLFCALSASWCSSEPSSRFQNISVQLRSSICQVQMVSKVLKKLFYQKHIIAVYCTNIVHVYSFIILHHLPCIVPTFFSFVKHQYILKNANTAHFSIHLK